MFPQTSSCRIHWSRLACETFYSEIHRLSHVPYGLLRNKWTHGEINFCTASTMIFKIYYIICYIHLICAVSTYLGNTMIRPCSVVYVGNSPAFTSLGIRKTAINIITHSVVTKISKKERFICWSFLFRIYRGISFVSLLHKQTHAHLQINVIFYRYCPKLKCYKILRLGRIIQTNCDKLSYFLL